MALKFKVKNIPITIHLNFLIVVLLLSLNRIQSPAFLASWVVVIFVSIILHELGHALAAGYFGHKPSIELRGIAGLTFITRKETKKDFFPNIIISAAGPLTGILIGLLFLILSRLPFINLPALQIIFRDIIWVNLYWSLANLLPILPLDGGNICQLILTRLFKHWGRMITHLLSLLLILFTGIYFLLKRDTFIVLLAAYIAVYNLQMFRSQLKRGADLRYSPEISRGYYLLQQGQQEASITLCHELLEKVENFQVKEDIRKLLSRAYYHNQEYTQALQILKSLKNKNLEDKRLLGFIFFSLKDYAQARDQFEKVIFSSSIEGIIRPYFHSLLKTKSLHKAYDLATGIAHTQVDTDLLTLLAHELHIEQFYDRSLRLSTIIYNRTKSPLSAYNAACSLARSGDILNALKWLTKALDAGYTNREEMLSDEDLQNLHNQEGFQELVNRLPGS